MVATYANRVMTRATPLWPSHSRSTEFYAINTTAKLVNIKISTEPQAATTESHVEEAVNIVVRWYATNDQALDMSREDMYALIWAKQVE